MKGEDLFRETPDVLDRVRRYWDLDGLLPLPRWDVQCPACRSRRSDRAIQVRRYNLHVREVSPMPFRCDVMFKCRFCSATWTHGVAVPQDMHVRVETATRDIGVNSMKIPWRVAAELLGFAHRRTD